jgi:hypothetical protein
MADLGLVFKGTSILFSIVIVLAYISSAVHEDSFFLASSPAFIVGVLDDSHSNWGEMES